MASRGFCPAGRWSTAKTNNPDLHTMPSRVYSVNSVLGHCRSSVLSVFLLVLAVTTSVTGCNSDEAGNFFKSPNVEPIRTVVKTAVPLAYAASVAMGSMDGASPANALVSNGCLEFPCAAVVSITMDDQTLPVELESYGTVLVAGLWTSRNLAILTVYFIDMDAGSSIFSVSNVSTFPAIKTSNGVKIVYPNVNIDIETGALQPEELTEQEVQSEYDRLNAEHPDDPKVGLDMDAWIVDIDNAGTSADYSDDRYTISGGGQYIDVSSDAGSVLQLGMALVEMAGDCAANPGGGLAVLNQVAASSSGYAVAGQALLRFRPECDGKAQVAVASGSYLGSIGESIPLRLNER
jgi:hypothetical protein